MGEEEVLGLGRIMGMRRWWSRWSSFRRWRGRRVKGRV